MDIVGIGNPCIDLVSVVENLPTPNKGSRVLDFSRQGGGVTPTAMVAVARLGAQVGFFGVWGGCAHGRAITEDFLYHGIDIAKCVIQPEEISDFAIVLSDLATQGRSILYRRGTTRSLTLADLDKDYIQSARLLHLDHGDELRKRAADWMHEAGGRVTFDASTHSEQVDAFLPYVDAFIASEFYYDQAFGGKGTYQENCRSILDRGPSIAVFTLGEKGCVGMSKKDGYFAVDGFRAPVRDTLGAGDVYHGAYVFALSKEMSAPEAARFANAVAAIKCGAIGGRAGIPSYDVTMKYLETGVIDDEEIQTRVEYYRRKWLFG